MILTLLSCDVVMGASSAHHAVRASVCFEVLLSHASRVVPSLSRYQLNLFFHLSFCLLPLQLHSILFLQLLQTDRFLFRRFYTELLVWQACRKRFGHSLSMSAENWTCFIETNPHVHWLFTFILIIVPPRVCRMCGFFTSGHHNVSARTTFCIDMTGLRTFAFLNVMHL